MLQDKIGEDIINHYVVPFLSKYVVNRNGKLITRIQDIETRFKIITDTLKTNKIKLLNNGAQLYLILSRSFKAVNKYNSADPVTTYVNYYIYFDCKTKETTIDHRKTQWWRNQNYTAIYKHVTNIPLKVFDENCVLK